MPPALQEPAGAAGNGADGFASPPGSSARTFKPLQMSADVSYRFQLAVSSVLLQASKSFPVLRAQSEKL